LLGVHRPRRATPMVSAPLSMLVPEVMTDDNEE